MLEFYLTISSFLVSKPDDNAVISVGKLEVKEDSFNRLYDTAQMLNMSVLIKLLDAQLVSPAPAATSEPETKNKRKNTSEDDPLNQVK